MSDTIDRSPPCPTEWVPRVLSVEDDAEARRAQRLLESGTLKHDSPRFHHAIAAGTSESVPVSSADNDLAARRLQVSQRLREQSFVDNVTCAYQAKWDVARNRLAGMEALARWLDPDLGLVSPGEFIPLAEEEPEIVERLGERVLLMACKQRLEWRGMIPDGARVAVNISATELRSGRFHEKVKRCLAQTGLPARLLEIEITESAAIIDFTKSVEQLLALRREGIGIAIDDFGVGFSSLSYLARLPASSLKIDRSFVRAIEEGNCRGNLLRAICGLGRAMCMTVVVEGVESLVTARWLRGIGCDVVQGFAISRPLPAAAFLDWYQGERTAVAAALDDLASTLQSARYRSTGGT